MAKESLSRGWRFLILANIFLSLFGIYLAYSQNALVLEILKEKIPVSIAEHVPQSAVVINPITGQFVFVNPFSLLAGLLAVLIAFAIWLYKKVK